MNGFCRNAAFSSGNPCSKTASSEFPDVKITFTSGRSILNSADVRTPRLAGLRSWHIGSISGSVIRFPIHLSLTSVPDNGQGAGCQPHAPYPFPRLLSHRFDIRVDHPALLIVDPDKTGASRICRVHPVSNYSAGGNHPHHSSVPQQVQVNRVATCPWASQDLQANTDRTPKPTVAWRVSVTPSTLLLMGWMSPNNCWICWLNCWKLWSKFGAA